VVKLDKNRGYPYWIFRQTHRHTADENIISAIHYVHLADIKMVMMTMMMMIIVRFFLKIWDMTIRYSIECQNCARGPSLG